MILALIAFCAAMAALTGLGIWHTIRTADRSRFDSADQTRDDAEWLDPHATWLPGGRLGDQQVRDQFDAMIAAEWPKEKA